MTLPTYSTGTASVAFGGTVVTGASTLWSGINVKQGDFIAIGSAGTALITEVTDTTHLKITPWTGAAQSSASYVIYQNYVGRVVGVAAAEDVGDMLERLKGYGPLFAVPDADAAPDPSYGAEGQYAYQQLTNKWWLKSGGVWTVFTPPASAFVAKAGDTMTGSLTLSGANTGFEVGSTAAVNTPFIDFHSSGNAIDYDVRLSASGGTGTAGNGTLALAGAAMTVPTPAVGDNSTKVATTAFVKSAIGANTFQQADRLAASFLTLTSGVTTNIISFSLPAGKWLVWGNVVFAAQATTAYSETHVSISTTSGALDTSPGSANAEHVTYATGQSAIKPTAPKYLSLASSTTVYLTATHTLTGGSAMLAYGSIFALPVGP